MVEVIGKQGRVATMSTLLLGQLPYDDGADDGYDGDGGDGDDDGDDDENIDDLQECGDVLSGCYAEDEVTARKDHQVFHNLEDDAVAEDDADDDDVSKLPHPVKIFPERPKPYPPRLHRSQKSAGEGLLIST